MGYGASNKEFNTSGVALPTFEPGIHEGVRIESIEAGVKTRREGEETISTPTIDITFLNPNTGDKHTAQEKEPQDEDKQSSFFEKMLHILNSFLSEADMKKALETELKSFKDLQKWMNKLHKEHYGDTLVDVKIAGKVYSGSPFTQLPNFNARYTVPFIKNHSNKNITLNFNKGELSDLAKYKAKVSGDDPSAAASQGSMGGGTQQGQAPTPTNPGF